MQIGNHYHSIMNILNDLETICCRKSVEKFAKKIQKERNHDEVLALRSYMVGLRSFELYSPKMQIALCRVVRFEAFGRGRIIVRIGAKGTSMYFIR